MNAILIEKAVGAAVILTATVVGVMTICHGDLALGLLVVLGQVQSLVGSHHHGHSITEEAVHVVAHKQP